MKYDFLARLVRASVAAAASLLVMASAAHAYDFQHGFTHYANGESLKSTLTSFARAQGLKPVVSPKVKGRISGRFSNIPAKDFLTAINEAYDVGYYVAGQEIHFFNSSEIIKEFLTVRNGTSRDLIESLRSSGFLADELPLTVNDQNNMLTIVGPASYVSQLKTAATAFAAVQSEKIVMRVFPLKHAWAEDISVTSMDKTITIPGIATVLRAMVIGGSVGGQTVTQEKATVEKLGGHGLAAQGKSTQTESGPQAANTPINQGSVSIIADPRVNAVLVSDALYRMSYYEQVIKDLDKPVDLVEIHAAIVDIDTSSQRDLGVNLAAGFGNNGRNKAYTGGNSTTPDTSDPLATTGALISTVYTHGSHYFMSRIQLLEEKNQARVLGRPSVLTVDNIQATLENTTTYYVKVEGKETVDLFKVEAGTVLRVTPHIIREGGKTSIKLAVNVQDDQENGSSASSSSSAVPPIKQTKINTQAVIEEGQSLLVGGYYYERHEDGDSGVPLLKDIPLIGNLFKTSTKSGKRMERLILLTPRIVTPDMRNVPAQAESPLMHISPQESTYELNNPMVRVPSAAKK